MARRKYYKKRYYKRSNYSSNNQEIDPIAGFIVLLFLFSYMTYEMFIKNNIDNIVFFLKIFVPILVISAGLIIFYLHKRKKEKEQKRIDSIPNFLLELESKIKQFKPLRHYKSEELYQTGLYGFLQNNYPNLEIEKSIEFSRPDIIIDDIAIEIKGPTNMTGLKTLPDKINQYLPKRKYLFIVLFDINIISDEEKNMEIYENKKNEILENTIDSKRDKIFFIEM